MDIRCIRAEAFSRIIQQQEERAYGSGEWDLNTKDHDTIQRDPASVNCSKAYVKKEGVF